MISVALGDGNTARVAHVGTDNALRVLSLGIPSATAKDHLRAYRGLFATSAAATDQRVNGSVTAVDFYIAPGQDTDRYIIGISFLIVDASMTLAKWGNLAALTNGCTLTYQTDDVTVTLGNVKTNYELARLCGLNNPTILSNVVSTSEGLIMFLDIRQVFGLPFGILLRRGSNHRINWRVADDLSTGMDAQDMIAYGFDRLP